MLAAVTGYSQDGLVCGCLRCGPCVDHWPQHHLVSNIPGLCPHSLDQGDQNLRFSVVFW